MTLNVLPLRLRVLAGFVVSVAAASPAWAVRPNCLLVAERHAEGRLGAARTFLEAPLENQAAVTIANRKVVAEFSKSGSKAEQWSGKHQQDLEAFLESAIRKVGGINREALLNGEADSDKGKNTSYKKLLTETSPSSEALFNFCKGHGKSGAVLREILSGAGHEDAVLLNPEIPNAEIRDMFKVAFTLQGFLHELPGLADALVAYEAGALTRDQFKQQIAANLFHNGPLEGFWATLGKIIVPGNMRGAGYDPAKVFSGTVFGKGKDGQLSYPSPVSPEGVLHTIADRLSQGTTGGIVKIYYEIIGFMRPLEAISELLILNPDQTSAQFGALRAHINALVGQRQLTPQQAEQLSQMTQLAQTRLTEFAAATRQAFGNFDRVAIELNAKKEIEEIVFDGVTYRADLIKTPEAKEEFINKILASLRRIEQRIGNPVGPVP